jgi:hypothetical protein
MIIKNSGGVAMRPLIIIVLCCAVIGVGVGGSKSFAGNPYIDIPAEQRRANELRRQTIGKWTDRQRQLDRAISQEEEAYRQQTGQRSIPVTPQNQAILMQRIGAQPHEDEFVLERMKVYQNVGESLQNGEELLEEIDQKMREWQ